MIRVSRFLIVFSVLTASGLAGAARNIGPPVRFGSSVRDVRLVRAHGVDFRVEAVARKVRGGFGVCLVVTARVTDRRVHGIDPHPLLWNGTITYADGSGTGWLTGFSTTASGWAARVWPGVPRTFTRCYPDHKGAAIVPPGAELEMDVRISSVQSYGATRYRSPKLGQVVLRVSPQGRPWLRIRPPKP